MLSSRLFSAAIIISVVLLFVFADAFALFDMPAGLFLIPVQFVVSVGTAYEFAKLSSIGTSLSLRWCVVVCALAQAIACQPILWPFYQRYFGVAQSPIGLLGWALLAATFVMCAMAVESLLHYGRTRRSVIERFSVSCSVILYPIVFAHFLMCLRLLDLNVGGLLLLVGVIATVKMSDAGAYFIGRAVGKHKLHAVISPGKTIEGAIGALVTGALTASIYFLWLDRILAGNFETVSSAIPFWGPAIAGAALALTGLVGDLFESVAKRSAAVKDSGNWLPGLGGIWDVTDSLLAAAPIGYLMALIGWIGVK